ncbi:MAG TPA: tetratricopeptide repeat protein [Pirellulaceae bacterium]|nr:tetratricopeptide repeat protein [Pirellulaceae bacterium]
MKLKNDLLLIALSMVLPALLAAQDSAEDLLQQATRAAQRGKCEQAVAILSDLLAKEPKLADAWYLRGREHFRIGKVKESVADFDQLVQLKPDLASRQWERGISCYYAGEYEKGARQFELYQTYHDQDVENSTWRYLCVSRTAGVEKARQTLLPIDNDRRVPMMEIFALYQGKLAPEEVLKAAEAGEPNKEQLNIRLFYAHLYIGLWHEAAGKDEPAKTHILEAEKHKIGHYMWDVAHVHAERLREEDKK